LKYSTTQRNIRHLILALCVYAGLLSLHGALAADEPATTQASISDTISGDYKSFYKGERLLRMGIAFGAAGIVANTNIDMNIRNWYQDKVRNEQTDSWASNPSNDLEFNAKFFGEGKYMVPVALLAASVNYIDTDTAVGNWGANASRAYIVGLPAMWFMQSATGATRPGDRPEGSSWTTPFGHSNGVSGHAFVGAVPFLTIAYMNPDNKLIKYPAYIASVAAAWSRVNDDKHFPSQVFLGWYMAWEAVDAVFENNEKKKAVTLTPMVELDGFGLMARGNW
jgi:PAP2 superfamily